MTNRPESPDKAAALAESPKEHSSADSLQAAFPRSILPGLAPRPSWPEKHPLRRRFDVLSASGPYPAERSRRWKLRVLRAEKAALEAYLDAALACGVLDREMLGLLRGPDPDGYRAAVSECMACWVLAAKVRLRVGPRPDGRRGKQLDLIASSERAGQELHI